MVDVLYILCTCTQELAGVSCDPFSEEELPEVDDSMIIGICTLYLACVC